MIIVHILYLIKYIGYTWNLGASGSARILLKLKFRVFIQTCKDAKLSISKENVNTSLKITQIAQAVANYHHIM